jgi:hypothetical protein
MRPPAPGRPLTAAAGLTSCSAWAARTRTSTPATTRDWPTSTSRSAACGAALPDHAWTARWHDHLQRLEDLRDKTGASAWNAALSRVTSADRTLVSLLLKGNLST